MSPTARGEILVETARGCNRKAIKIDEMYDRTRVDRRTCSTWDCNRGNSSGWIIGVGRGSIGANSAVYS